MSADHATLTSDSAEPSPRGFDAFWQRIARDAARSDKRWQVFTCEVPVAATPERLLALAGEGFFWSPAPDQQWLGLGVCAELSASGRERFAQIEAQAAQLWLDLDTHGAEIAPRVFGGFAFADATSETGLWRKFGGARLFLPKLGYVREHGRALLQVCVERRERENAGLLFELRKQLLLVWQALSQTPTPERAARLLKTEERPFADWERQIRAIVQLIEQGSFVKLVLARKLALHFERQLRAESVLERLLGESPECTRFAFRTHGSTFLGATPEHLIAKHGQQFQTEALAGSAPLTDPSYLLDTSKNRGEHAVVARELMRRLVPVAEKLDLAQCDVLTLRHVAHFRQRIQGELQNPLHILNLVERLHPTPAIAGLPHAEAIHYITENEVDERGWYTGPFGWFDAKGDGQFVVALRSALIHGNDAHLYAGCGIMRDSDAESEFAETRWKMRALLAALGVS